MMTEVYNFFQIKATALTDELRIYNLTISGNLKKLFKGIGFVCKKSGRCYLQDYLIYWDDWTACLQASFAE
jgi:hypothetical protein